MRLGRTFAPVAVVSLSLALAAAASGRPLRITHPTRATDRPTVTYLMGIPGPDPAAAAYLIPQFLHFYRDNGINVDLRFVSAGNVVQNWQLIANGQGDISIGSPEPLVAAAANGTPIGVKFVYNLVRIPIWYVLTPKSSSIRGYGDLKGKTIGVNSLGSPGVQFVQAGLKDAGLSPSDVRFVAVGVGPGLESALDRGTVDAVCTYDFDKAAVDGHSGQYRVLPRPKLADRLLGAGLVSSPQYISQHAKQVAGFLRAVTMGTIFIQANPKAAVQILWQMYPVAKPSGVPTDQAIKAAMNEMYLRNLGQGLQFKTPKLWGAYNLDEWRAEAEFLGVQNKISDYQQFFTNQFVKQVNAIDQARLRRWAKKYVFTGNPGHPGY